MAGKSTKAAVPSTKNSNKSQAKKATPASAPSSTEASTKQKTPLRIVLKSNVSSNANIMKQSPTIALKPKTGEPKKKESPMATGKTSWSAEEEARLIDVVSTLLGKGKTETKKQQQGNKKKLTASDWEQIARQQFPNRNANDCQQKYEGIAGAKRLFILWTVSIRAVVVLELSAIVPIVTYFFSTPLLFSKHTESGR